MGPLPNFNIPPGTAGARPAWWKALNTLGLVGLSLGSILSFFSMGMVVAMFFLPTASYEFAGTVPVLLGGFFLLSQLIPGYFARTRRLMLASLIFSAAFVGVVFTIMNPVTGPIYGGACAVGNWLGFKLRISGTDA